ALLLGLLDHVPGDARLDRAGRIHELELGEHAVDLEQRRVADGVEDGAGDAGVAHSVGLHWSLQRDRAYPWIRHCMWSLQQGLAVIHAEPPHSSRMAGFSIRGTDP